MVTPEGQGVLLIAGGDRSLLICPYVSVIPLEEVALLVSIKSK